MNKGIKIIQWMFVIALFLFAFEPMVEKNEQLDDLLMYFICGIVVIASVGAVICIIKDRLYFLNEISKLDIFSTLEVIIGLFGLIISYIYKSDNMEIWIFYLMLDVPFYIFSNKDKKAA